MEIKCRLPERDKRGRFKKLKKSITRNRTLLCNAARNGNIKRVKALLNANTDINFKNKNGLNPLHIAASNGHYKTTMCLVRAGADCNVLNYFKMTPLFFAAKFNHVEIVESLIKAGAAVNLKDKNGNTPLFIATERGHYDAAVCLLDAGADCNAICEYKRTPLHCAAIRGHVQLVEVLIKRGASLNTLDYLGLCPFWLTAFYYKNWPIHSYPEILICLVRAGAKPYSNENDFCSAYFNIEQHELFIRYCVLFGTDSVKPVFSIYEEYLSQFWDICADEVESMKWTLLGNSYISLLKFLKENDVSKLVNYLSVSGVRESLLESVENFPNYDILKTQLLKALQRTLVYHVIESVIFKCDLKVFPWEIRNTIYAYLSDSDLINLKECLEMS